jgi:tripartite-type tricarboxylate transporter receptor subunit TctC
MTASSRRRFLTLTAAAFAVPALPHLAGAEAAWPAEKTIRALVPFSAGSTIDIIGRIVLEPLSRQIGQTILVENRGGAGGSLGSALVAKAVLLVAPSKGFKSLKDFVAKAQEGNLTYASAGVGSATHWAAERFRVSAGFKGTHVPFRGGPEALTEVMTGRVDFVFIGITSGLPFVRNGQLQALAVSSAKRSPALPDVQTTLEAGYKDSDFNYWNGMLVPAKTPRAIVDRLYAEVTKALALPDVQTRLATQGVEPAPLTPIEMDAMIKREIDLNLKIAQSAGLKFN